MSLEGKVALVTGATSGIGLASARAMAAAGMKLVIAGQRASLLEENAKALGECVSVAGDVTEPGAPEALFERALEAWGRLDVVMNNAGLVENGPAEAIDLDRVSRMVRVNVELAFRVMYLAIRHFKRQGSGHLVNTSSVLGIKVRPHIGAYAGTKHAVEALAEALRLEVVGSGIRVTCVEPGLVATDLHRDFAESPSKMQGIDEPLTPEDVARSVMFALEQPPHVLIPRVLILPREQPM
jgi:NADP-dependent 3-hydroxy acid dehydrogenase YdfG